MRRLITPIVVSMLAVPAFAAAIMQASAIPDCFMAQI